MSIISEKYGRLVSAQEAADILTRRAGGIRKYTPVAIHRMVSMERLAPVEKIGGANFFRPDDIEKVHIVPKRGQPSTRTRKGIGDTGITRKELAQRSGVAETTVWNAFHGNPISQDVADKLLQAFNSIKEERKQKTATLEEMKWHVIEK
jgi:hypothetical protein